MPNPFMDDAESDAALACLAPGHARLVSLALQDRDALAALSRLTDKTLAAHRSLLDQPPQRSRRSTPAALADALDRSERDSQLDALVNRMASATPAGRSALVEMAARLHTADERRDVRKRLLRQYREVHCSDFRAREAARCIASDLAHRQGEHIRSTGSAGKDQLCDRIVLTGLATSIETIRKIL